MVYRTEAASAKGHVLLSVAVTVPVPAALRALVSMGGARGPPSSPPLQGVLRDNVRILVEQRGGLWSPDDQVLLVADAAPQAPSIRRFTVGDAALTKLEPLAGRSSTGLPPRHLAFFR